MANKPNTETGICNVMLVAWFIGILFLSPIASAHELHGVNYSNWVSRAGKGCCNNQDCRPIEDSDVRLSPGVLVRVEGVWCPVHTDHYLKNGNAPDWQTHHICVQAGDGPPCERLLCFQPKPLF